TAIALFPLRNNDSKSASRTGRIGMLHLAFRANRKNFLSAQEELKRRGIKFEFQDHEISHSIYFRDPDGHELEITTYDLASSAIDCTRRLLRRFCLKDAIVLRLVFFPWVTLRIFTNRSPVKTSLEDRKSTRLNS